MHTVRPALHRFLALVSLLCVTSIILPQALLAAPYGIGRFNVSIFSPCNASLPLRGRKGLSVIKSFTLLDCPTTLQQSTLYLVTTSSTQTPKDVLQVLTSSDGPVKAYIYTYSDLQLTQERALQAAGNPFPFLTQNFFATVAALSDPSLGPALQTFASGHNITWNTSLTLQPNKYYLVIVVGSGEMTG